MSLASNPHSPANFEQKAPNRTDYNVSMKLFTGEITPEEEQKARLMVCSLAQDTKDAKTLLGMLGLLP